MRTALLVIPAVREDQYPPMAVLVVAAVGCIIVVLLVVRLWRQRRGPVTVDDLDAAALQRVVTRYNNEHVGED